VSTGYLRAQDLAVAPRTSAGGNLEFCGIHLADAVTQSPNAELRAVLGDGLVLTALLEIEHAPEPDLSWLDDVVDFSDEPLAERPAVVNENTGPPTDVPGNEFIIEGGCCRIRYRGCEISFPKATDGIWYIAYILEASLERKGQRISNLALYARLHPEAVGAGGTQSRQEVLDARAQKAIEQQLEDIRVALEDHAISPDDKVELSEKKAELERNMQQACNVHGQSRTFGDDPVERVRRRIGNAIRTAISKIRVAGNGTALAAHLTAALKDTDSAAPYYSPSATDDWDVKIS